MERMQEPCILVLRLALVLFFLLFFLNIPQCHLHAHINTHCQNIFSLNEYLC